MMKLFRYILFVGVMVVCGRVNGQTIKIVRSAFDSTYTYGIGANISVQIKLNICLDTTDNFKMYLSDSAGKFVGGGLLIGGYGKFFTPFVNGVIPVGTITGNNYRILIKSVNSPVAVSDTSPHFSISGTSSSFVPNLIPTSGSTTGRFNDSTYGKCNSTTNQNVSLDIQNIPSGYIIQAKLYDSSGNTASSVVNVGVNKINFIAVTGNYYTLKVLLINGSIYSIRSFLVIASTSNLSLGGGGANVSCKPVTRIQSVNIPPSQQGILNNYPGTIYYINWGDSSTNQVDYYTQCQLLSANGNMIHNYIKNSCGQPAITINSNTYYNTYKISINAGGFCNNFSPYSTVVNIFDKPTASFTYTTPGCINTPILFKSTSKAGYSATGSSDINCNSDLYYDWYVNNISVAVFTDTMSNNFTSPGIYDVKLVVNNNSCSDTVSHQICIQPQPIKDFKMNGLDSVFGCAPFAVAVTYNDNSATCSNNQYTWAVLDSTGVTTTLSSNYTYTNSTNANSQNPKYSFNVSGKYFIQLTVTNSCGTFTKIKPVLILGVTSVSFPSNKSYCGTNKTIDFSSDVSHFPVYNLPYSSSDTYVWTITGGTYSFVNSTTANSRYPQISFTGYGVYTVKITYTNNCGTKSATQIISFYQPVTAFAGNDTTICYSNNTLQLNAISNGVVGASGVWSIITGSGSFSNANIANPIYTFSGSDKTNLSVTLRYTVTPQSGSVCAVVSDDIIITIRPDNSITGVLTKSICSGDNVNYTPTATQSGSTFSWTSSVTAGAATGNTASGSGNINDVLTNTSSTTTATVQYIIKPTINSCVGNASTLVVTVNPKPSITLGVVKNPTQCGFNNGYFVLKGLAINTAYTITYNNVTQTSSITTIGDSLTITGLAAGTYNNISVSLNGCTSNAIAIVTLSDPTKPATPIVTGNTPICSSGTLQLGFSNTYTGTVTYNWSGPVSLTNATTASPSVPTITTVGNGDYKLFVTINNCKSDIGTKSIVVNQTPSAPIVTAKTYCQNEVAASLSPVGNNYVWYNNVGLSNGSTTSPTPSTTTVGTTTYYLIDSNVTTGCKSGVASLVVTVNPTPNISSTSKTDPAQCASSTGSITLNGLTANTAYSVSYNGVVQIPSITTTSTSITITGLAAGTYSNISVSLNGCPSNVITSVILSDPTKPATPIVTGNTPICSGGTLQLGFSNTYTGTVTYTWTGPVSLTNATTASPSVPTITTVGNGDYKLFVTINNCKSDIGTKSIVVNQTPTAPTTNSVTYCQGATAIPLSTTGANLIWYNNVALNNGSLTAPTPITTTVGATTYYVVDSSNAGCKSISSNIVVTVNATPVISNAIPTNPQQCQATNGSISFNVTPTTGSYTITYTKDGAVQPAINVSPTSGILTIPNLGAGLYENIKVILNGCPSNTLAAITLSDPTKPATPIVTGNTPICSGGTLQLGFSNTYTGTVTYTWSGPNGFSNTSNAAPSISSISTLGTGDYKLFVTIDNCKSDIGTKSIVVNQTPLTPITNAKTYCQNEIVPALIPSGNNYVWYNNVGLSNGSTTAPTPSTTTVGTTTYYVIDSNVTTGCKSGVASLVVTVNFTPIITLGTVTDPAQCQAANGSIKINGLPANTSFLVFYVKNGGSQITVPSQQSDASGTVVIPNLTAGTYSNIFVNTLVGCTSNTLPDVTLSDPTKPATPIVTGNTPICSGGTLQLGFSNTYTGTVTYTWSGPVTLTNATTASPSVPTITTAGNGDYKLFVTIDNCKSDIGTKSILVNQTPLAPITNAKKYCQNEIVPALIPSGNNYVWYNNVGLSNGSTTAPTPSTTTVGTTTYYVIDSNVTTGCKSGVASLVVTVNLTPIITLGTVTDPAQCQAANGSIKINGLPANTSFLVFYVKNGGSQITVPSQQSDASGTVVIPNLTAGTYSNIFVTTTSGCSSNTLPDVTLSDPTKPATPVITAPAHICSGNNLTLSATTSSSGTPTFNWVFVDGSTPSGATQTINNISVQQSGAYHVKVTINQCVSNDTLFQVTVDSTPLAPIIAGNTTVCRDSILKLTATTASSGVMNYNWTVPVGSFTNTPTVTIYNVTAANAGSYSVSATSTINASCVSAAATTTVIVNPTPIISNLLDSNPSQCATATGYITFNVVPTSGNYIVNYLKDGVAKTATINVNAGVIKIDLLSAGTYSNITVTLDACPSNIIGPITLHDPTPPATPIITGVDSICSGKTLTLNAASPIPNAIYTWTHSNGPSFNSTSYSITNINLSDSGFYTLYVTLNLCKSKDTSFRVRVDSTPVIPVVTTNSPVCTDNTIKLFTTNIYPMLVNYTWNGMIGFTSSQQNPTISNATSAMAGNYSLYVTSQIGGCQSSTATTVVTTNQTPHINFKDSTNPTQCAKPSGFITINGLLSTTVYTVNYTFNGTPRTVSFTTNATGELKIDTLRAGTYANINVTLNNCPSNSIGSYTLVDPNSPATPIITGVDSICSGKTLTLNAASPIPNAIYTWTHSNGPSFNSTSYSITNINLSDSGFYTLYVTLNLCKSKDTSFRVRVDSTPVIPVITTNSPVCTDSTIKLFTTNTYPMLVNYTWNGMIGFTSSQQNPTISNATSAMAGNYSLYVTSQIGGCQSSTATTVVTTNQTPHINFKDSTNPTQCATPSGFITINGLLSTTVYTVNYTFNGTPRTVSFTTNATGELKIDTLRAGTYANINVTLNNCPSNSIGSYTLVDPNPPATPIILGIDTICSGKNLVLNAASPIPNAIYTWTHPNGPSFNTTSYSISNINLSDSGLFTLYVTLNLCKSKDTSFRVRVDSTPVIPVVTTNSPVCTDSTIKLFTTNTYPMLVNYTWNGMIGFTSSQQNPTISNATSAMAGNYSLYVTSQIGGCQSSTATTVVTTNQTPHISFKDSTNPTQCAKPSGFITINGLLSTTVYTVNYTFNGTPRTVSFTTNATGELKIDTLRAGIYANINVTLNNCPSNSIGSYTLADPNPPATPIIIGVDSICSGQNLVLSAASPITNAIYTWTQPNTSTSIGTSLTINNISVAVSGFYKLYVTLNLCQSKDTSLFVRVDSTPVAPTIITNSPVCSDSTIVLKASTVSPGNMNYSWSGANSFISALQNPTIPNAQLINAGSYSVFATSQIGGCISAASSQNVVVNASPNVAAMPDTTYKDGVPSGLIAFSGNVAGTTFNWTNSNPTIGLSASGTGDIVSFTTSNTTPFPIFGLITVTPSTNFCNGKPITFKITVNPTPRLTSPFADTICTDNLWQYQATSSTPNVTYTWVRNTVAGISNAASASTDSSGLINETLTNTTSLPINVPYIFKLYSLGSVNNDTVKLTVNPDAKAVYTFTNDKLCAPGTIDTANIKLQPYASANGSFEWYADGVLIGTGSQFPGYTILNNGDTVKIRLKAISLYGCKSDSFEHSFYNVKTPVVSFIKSVATGCGPLSVNFTNTTTPLAYPSYKWDFGNGNTSTLQSPVNIIFREDTSNRRVDTTYYIKLTAYTECDSISYVDSVTVFAQPKALFQPDTTVGCSIFHFRAFNNSWGQHNTYTWDFGDSTAIVIDTAYGYYYHNFYTAVTDTFNVKLKAANKCGVDSFEVKIVVFPNTIVPKLIVDGNSNYGCAPVQVRFVNNTVGANKFTIKFGDGSLPYISNKNPDTVYHTYQSGGNFIATLKAQNSCTDSTVALTLQLYDKPQAKFYLSSNQFCKKETIQFKNLSDSTLSFEWWFGDGGTSTNLHPTHRYLNVGNYTITLIAKSTNPTGAVCTDTIRKIITVHDLPVSSFTNNAAIQNCQPYYFVGITNLLPSEIANWTFSDSFSNDTTQAGNVGVHTFKQVGIYQVQLVIFNVHGCTDTSSTHVKVIETPKVAFAISDTLSCIPGKSVTCTNQTTYSAADAVNYQWYINGVLQATTKDLNYTFNVPVTITTAANFVIKLVAINSYGCRDSATKLFVIYPKAQPAFAINATVGCVPFHLQFNNTTQYANVFNWYLDGQLFSTLQVPNPIVLSNPATTYTIKLIANHTLGCGADSITKSFTTYTKPVADFLIPNKNSCTGILNIQCFDLSSVVGANITKWNWIFGDGAKDTTKNPTHTYNTAGHFNVGLVATDNRGCKSDIAYQVVANFGKPKANFSVGNVCVRNPLMPINLSTPGLGSTAITNYLWNFGDGNYLTGSQPIYVYQNEGNYTLTLIVTSDSSCVADTLQKTVTVYGKPTANFKFENNCVNENTLFTNTSLSGFGQSLIGNSKWLFGDGGSSNNYNAAHIFNTTKDYVVQLTVSGNRCPNLTDSIKKVVTVHKPRDPVIYPRIEGVRGTPIQLYALSGGVQYNWIPITGLDNAGIQNPIGNYNVSHPNIISYTINITDSLGCKVKDKQEIWLFADADIFVPTAFTPNGDGANDILKPLYVNIAKINYFRIFDRWGKEVFETSDMGKGWDGTLNGNNLPMETYSWMISAITQQGKELIRKGNATLIRN